MNAQKIADIKAAAPESLWHFLSQLPASMEAQIFYGLLISGLVGMLASWLWKFANGQVGGLHTYLFREHVLRSFASLMGVLGTGLLAIMAGVFETDTGVFVGWLNVLWWGAQSGFGIDLAINRGGAARRP